MNICCPLRAFSICMKRGNADAGFPLFESESLKWPGFVEFDDVNGKVVTYSAEDSTYKVFDMTSCMMLYSVSDKNVQEVKISPGALLLVFKRARCHVPLKILSIEDGSVLKSFNHIIHRSKKVDFIQLFNEKPLIKQENENLQILDVRNFDLTGVSSTEFVTPSAFIFICEEQLFLTLRNQTVSVWNSRGERLTSFEDHLLWNPECNTNNTYATDDQEYIISYCRDDSDDAQSKGNGSVSISHILNGKSLAKIRASVSHSPASRIRSKDAEALKDITAFFNDEARNEIYTGNNHG